MTITLTVPTVFQALRDAVDEKGKTFVYEQEPHLGGCAYVHDVDVSEDEDGNTIHVLTDSSEPGCLVGNALHRLGVPLWAFLHNNSDSDAGEILDVLRRESLVRFSSDDEETLIRRSLMSAQAKQDAGHEWNTALQAAEDRLHDEQNRRYEDF